MLIAALLRLLNLGTLSRRQAILKSIGGAALAPLKFQADGTFQISIFSDLHFGESMTSTPSKVINSVLDAEPSVDLVILNGDLITGNNAFLENATYYIDQLVQPMMQRGLSWASTYGNHDSDFNISRADILAREQSWAGARTTSMVSGGTVGVTNYLLPVFGADCDSPTASGCTPELILWFFDSRGGFLFQQTDPSTGKDVPQPDWVDHRVVEWFQQTNAALVNSAGKTIPSLAFVHIPTNASSAFQHAGVNEHRQPVINDDKPLSSQGQGWCEDGTNGSNCAYGKQDVPFMSAIASTPGLLAVFSGHDHGDTWCFRWDRRLPGMDIKGNGVNLCFGQHSGYGGYGSWMRGARQVVISKEKLADSVVDTHIRLETGHVVGSVTLNSTYGEDWYPATPNDRSRCPTC
ncbi:Metallo-dependent phosphatase-like protein [Podospora aff. communis PSN243]|uniref:Metallo-dependent phosphatase-like protein n=1 Tax=Podospora aff. communis PSN243 TaxID=3040156 RepID=A0AAV9G468_9PEZI|nr:Metallo-dependent phosphatase-like protein [Podospora aff. communis PSN243]